jgi:hypothetical protein
MFYTKVKGSRFRVHSSRLNELGGWNPPSLKLQRTRAKRLGSRRSEVSKYLSLTEATEVTEADKMLSVE